MKNGAIASATTISTKAICSARLLAWPTGAVMSDTAGAPSIAAMSGPSSEQTGGSHQQHDRHDDEDHRIGSFRTEHLGETLDHAEAEAGDDRTHDRAHAADHHHRKHHDDQR